MEAVRKAFDEEGYRFVILESPVGSGKSAIATTLARYYGDSHILTPKKSLQDQYFGDFNQFIHLMKGRSSYPCVWWDATEYDEIARMIYAGDTPNPKITGRSTAEGRCKGGLKRIREECNMAHTCPYELALGVAQGKDHVVHNLHSFIFQAAMAFKFSQRELLVIDECHNVEDICRDLLSRSITVRGKAGQDFQVPRELIGEGRSLSPWCNFLSDKQFWPSHVVEREEYLEQVESLLNTGMDNFVVDWKPGYYGTKFTFIPKHIGGIAHHFMFNFGKRILLMSGTIYDKATFCAANGIRQEEAKFIQVGSTFPSKNRPVAYRAKYGVDMSHAKLEDNMPRLKEVITQLLERFPDKKGLIHSSSYRLAEDLANLVQSPRIMTHTSENFREKLDEFFASSDPLVFLSPTCTEGVDFKDDRARWQVILRVPNPNAGDKLTATLMKENYAWYNLKALVTFGQQIGRINRSESDFGITILLDSRFPQFIRRNAGLIPPWLMKAVDIS